MVVFSAGSEVLSGGRLLVVGTLSNRMCHPKRHSLAVTVS